MKATLPPQIAKFMGPTWGPPGSCRSQMDPVLATWTLLSRIGCLKCPRQRPATRISAYSLVSFAREWRSSLRRGPGNTGSWRPSSRPTHRVTSPKCLHSRNCLKNVTRAPSLHCNFLQVCCIILFHNYPNNIYYLISQNNQLPAV